MIGLITSIALLAIPITATAEPNEYLCVVEQSAGLHYNQQIKQYASQEFSTTRKYIFRRLKDEDRDDLIKHRYPQDDWGFFEFGKPHPDPQATCVEDSSLSLFLCHEYWSMAQFDKDSLRFELIRHGGYVDQGYWEHLREKDPDEFKRLLFRKQANDPDHPSDLFFEIGRRSRF